MSVEKVVAFILVVAVTTVAWRMPSWWGLNAIVSIWACIMLYSLVA